MLSTAAALEVVIKLSQFATAIDYQRAAKKDEARGYRLTAAYEVRRAAELYGWEPSMAEGCWRKWESLTGVPRELSSLIE